MSTIPESCTHLQNPPLPNFIISILILLGLLLSYLPQHHRLLSLRTSLGISPYFVLLGTTSATAAFFSILTLPTSQRDIACCPYLSAFEAFAALLGIAQIGVQWVCFLGIFALFLKFRANPEPDPLHDPTSPPRNPPILFLVLTHLLLLTLLSPFLTLYAPTPHLQTYSTLLGISATLLASLQYLPQLLTTWRLKEVGSLSVPMMCIQTPGGVVWATSLGVRLGWEGVGVWGVYAVSAGLQGGLLGMVGWFAWRRGRERVGEERALLGEERGEVG